MAKIAPITSSYTSAKNTLKAVKEALPAKIEQNVEKSAKSIYDLSCEELGYFIRDGKLVKIIFPR